MWDGREGAAQSGVLEFCRELSTARQHDLRVHPRRAAERARRRGDGHGPAQHGPRHARASSTPRVDGKLRVLSLFGVNPVLRYAGRRARARGAASDAVRRAQRVVPDRDGASTRRWCLPARGPFEKDGHVVDFDRRRPSRSAASHVPPPGTLTDGEMLVALAAELGVGIPNPQRLAALARCQQPPTSRQRGPRGPADRRRDRGAGARCAS